MRWIEEFADREIFVISAREAPEWGLGGGRRHFLAARTLPGVEEVVRPLGRVDVVVSLVDPPSAAGDQVDQLGLFRRLFPLVAAGGMYLVDRRAAPAAPDVQGLESLTRLFAAAEDPDLADSLNRRDGDLARSIGAVVLTRDLLLTTKRFDDYFKIRDADVDQVLAAREPGLRVSTLHTEPGGILVPRAPERSHGVEASEPALPAEVPYPEMRARHHVGRIASADQMLLYTGSTILPDSFRWPLAENPNNPRLIASTPDFARIEKRDVPARELPGSFYALDCIHSEHFGHLTTEVVPRFWAWDAAKKAIPDLKVLFHVKRRNTERPTLQLQLLSAYGIDESDVVWVNEPVWLESVVTATPMWHNHEPHYAHPGMLDIWTRMTDRLLPLAGEVETFERIFVSRGGHLGRRRCRNQGELEAYFAQRGFQVVYPERHSLPEQAAIFADARVVAGFAGSAMFNLMHARKLETTIVLSHDAYHHRNEQLFCALLGGQFHYFRSKSDLEHPEDGFDRQALRSSWAFDFDRFGADLDRVVAES
jgi:capsular polysaccharide biosynthesis protein